ncbi:hypothetical protein GCM10022392_15160 [Mucilaginibacter panaciglaebae]|uniref:Uncharacterized protein n=1 Tax=Mucilaginibacter panaciglaebae TaxID=502331 RepID=A0ABP7WPR6_9SPHI
MPYKYIDQRIKNHAQPQARINKSYQTATGDEQTIIVGNDIKTKVFYNSSTAPKQNIA